MPGNDPRVQQESELQREEFLKAFPFRCPGRGLPHPQAKHENHSPCSECEMCVCGERLYCKDV